MSTKEPYTYFQPGEMLFLLNHAVDKQIDEQINEEAQANPESNRTFDDVITSWISVVNGRVKDAKLSKMLTIFRCNDREIHFGGTLGLEQPPVKKPSYEIEYQPPKLKTRGAFSLIPVEVRLATDERADGPELIELMIYLESIQTELENSLNKLRKKGESQEDAADQESRIAVDTVQLNWLASPASEYGGGGGPGARPSPYRGISGTAPYRFEIPSAQAFLTADECQRGKGVTIAVLDTSPSLHDMAAVYERYHKLNPRNRLESHPLIESLLKPNGHFHVHPASLDDLLRMRAVHLRDHDYEMSDHGLFVAGILHTIAPEAEIHLYEVLSPSGVGDLLSIARGMRKVLDDFAGQPLVVNCSFVLNIPLLNHLITDLDPKLLEVLFQEPNDQPGNGYLTKDDYECGKEWLARQGRVIEWICDQLPWHGARAIAAAGNDWKSSENKDRPQARFPAAFESVLGIGALPKNAQFNASRQYLPASYSNLSDSPESSGIVALGGEPGESAGILGIYLGKFPALSTEGILQNYSIQWSPLLKLLSKIRWLWSPKNTNNWAWWSGTSFATPIVTGLVAVALSNLARPATAEAAIQELYGTKVIQDSVTTSAEDGIVEAQQV